MNTFQRMIALGVVLAACSLGCSRSEKVSETKAVAQPHETTVTTAQPKSGQATSARAASHRSSTALKQEKTAPDEVIHSLATPWPFGDGSSDDDDRDGITNAKDRCPSTYPGARVNTSGCPLDGDGDGVPDGIDRCERTAKGTRVDATGCPAEPERAGLRQRG